MIKNKKRRTANAVRRKSLKSSIKQRRPAHKRFLLNPASIFSLLIIGLLLVGFTFYNPLKNWADSYLVSAVVPAPPLTSPAVITYPADGTIITSSPLTVDGTCPQNQSNYVDLIRNGSFSGSAICSNGTFQITTDLTPGVNTLQAQDYNITNQPGPSSPAISITYTPSSPIPSPVVPNSPTSKTPPPNETNANPFLLTTNYIYASIYVGQEYSWQLHVSGGTKPYSISIQWGDGSASDINVNSQGNFDIAHTYNSPGIFNLLITATDSEGAKAMIQVSVNVKPALAGAATTHKNTLGPLNVPKTPFPDWLHAIWPFYVIAVLMALSYWLGEREEYRKLSKRGRLLKEAH